MERSRVGAVARLQDSPTAGRMDQLLTALLTRKTRARLIKPRATTLTVKELPTLKSLIPYRGVALKRKTSTGS
jgi:hypothetical protein